MIDKKVPIEVRLQARKVGLSVTYNCLPTFYGRGDEVPAYFFWREPVPSTLLSCAMVKADGLFGWEVYFHSKKRVLYPSPRYLSPVKDEVEYAFFAGLEEALAAISMRLQAADAASRLSQ